MRDLLLRHTPLRHFTDEQRGILERLWNVNVIRGRDTRLSMRAFAKENAVPYPTLRRELYRVMEGGLFFDNIKKEWFYPEYSAEKAVADAARGILLTPVPGDLYGIGFATMPDTDPSLKPLLCPSTTFPSAFCWHLPD